MKPRQVLFLVGLLLVGVGAGWAYQRHYASFRLEGSGEFADLVEGQVATRTFALRNDTSKPIKVLAVRSSCGCTSSALGKDAVIAPRTSKTFEVALDTTGREGDLRQTVTVQTDAYQSPIVIPVHASVRRELIFDDLIGEIVADKGGKAEKIVRVHWANPGRFDITGVRTLGGEAKAKIVPVETRKSYEIHIIPETARAKKAWSDTLVLETTCPQLRERQLKIQGIVRSSITVDPPTWFVGHFVLSEPRRDTVTQTFRVKSSQPFKIVSTDVQGTLGLAAKPKTIFYRAMKFTTDREGEDALETLVSAVFD